VLSHFFLFFEIPRPQGKLTGPPARGQAAGRPVHQKAEEGSKTVTCVNQAKKAPHNGARAVIAKGSAALEAAGRLCYGARRQGGTRRKKEKMGAQSCERRKRVFFFFFFFFVAGVATALRRGSATSCRRRASPRKTAELRRKRRARDVFQGTGKSRSKTNLGSTAKGQVTKFDRLTRGSSRSRSQKKKNFRFASLTGRFAAANTRRVAARQRL